MPPDHWVQPQQPIRSFLTHKPLGLCPPQPQFCLTQFEVEFWPCNPKNPIIMSLRAMCVEGHFLMLGRKGGGTANSLGST